MKIKLKCITAGFKYGDIVKVGKAGKDSIDESVAKDLLGVGLAIELEEVKVAKKDIEPKKEK